MLRRTLLQTLRSQPVCLKAPVRFYTTSTAALRQKQHQMQQPSPAAMHAETQHRAELQEEYSDLAEGDKDEYYIDCIDIASKWPQMSHEQRQDMIAYLKIKQEFGWMYLSHDEKRAIWYIAYGEWGPRSEQVMNMAQGVFKLMASGLLFAALGLTIINYSKDKQVEKEILEQVGQSEK